MIATSSVSIVNVNDGATGATGPQGVSVTKVVEEYRLSNSSTELTGSGTGYTWSETKPDIPSGKYLWIRERTDLSNNTSSYGTAHCDIVISGLVQDVDRNSGVITSKVWESYTQNSINEYDGSTGAAIRDRVTQTETSITGITSRVSDVESETDSLGTRMTSAESSITQNANNIALKVSQDGVISSINQSPETIKISASKVNIEGAVTFSSFDSTLQNRLTTAESDASTAKSNASSAVSTANTASSNASSALTKVNNSIKSTTMHYLATSASSGVTTSTSGWTTTIQSITKDKPYLWTYQTVTKINDTTSNTDPVISGVYGATGGKGDTGTGVTKVEQLYRTSNSTTAPAAPTSAVSSTSTSYNTWTLAMPTYNTSYPYYYICTQTTYDNGTVKWTTVSRSKALEDANSTANTANTNASNAVSTANTANTNASNAVSTANTANTNASNAVTTANQAKSKADSAASLLSTWTGDATLATTTINGGYIKTHTIESTHLATNAIMSQNYSRTDTSSPYSSTGAFLDLETGTLYMPNFGVNGTTGASYFNGTVNANAGKFGDDTSYWNIETVYDYNMQPHAALVGTGSPYLQTGNWQVSDNAVATRKYTSTSESAGNATYYKDSGSNTFYDVGMKIPTNFAAYSTSDSSVVKYNKAFYYGRKYTGNSVPSLDSDWTYFFSIDSGGNVITAGDVYEGGTKLSEKYAAISDVGSVYLPKTGGTITGNLTVNGSFTTNLQVQTNLASTSAAQLTGNANATVTHGVTGTLGVGNGGTGQTTAQNAANAFINALSTGSTTSMLRDADYFISQYIGGGTSNTKYYRRPISTIWDYIKDKIETTYDITNTYRRLDDNDFDTINVTDLTAGNLIVNGAARFTNDVFADTFTGNLVGTASNAVKVGNNLVIKLNGGSTEGTNLFTYNGSAAKTINITASSIGAQASGTYAGGISNGGAASKLAYQSGNEINFVSTASTPPYQVHFNWRNGYTNTQTGTSSDINYYFENYNGEYNHTTLYAAQFSGNAATATTATTADKVGNNLVILFNSGSTEGTNKFTYNGSAAKNVNITKSSIGLGNVDNTADANKTVKEASKVTNTLKIQLNGGTTEGTNQFSYDGSAVKNINITKSSVGLGNVENTALSTWAGSANLTTTKVGTLAAAAAKGVDTSIGAASTSANLPTSAAVAAFVEGKGYATSTEVTTFVEGKGYVTSSGVTSVRVQATSPVVSSVNTAQSSTLNTTISLADGYGDTKNPYGTKTKNYILAGPGSGSAAAPTFRALVADDIPTLTPAKAGLGNVTNDKQVKGLSSGTTSGHLVSWGSDGYTVADSGITTSGVNKTVTSLASNDDGKIVLTYLDGTTSTPIEVKIIGQSGSSVSYADALNVNGTAVGGSEQPVYINNQGKPATANKIPKLNNTTTGGAFYAPTGAGSANQVLVSSGSGAPTWTTLTKSAIGLGNVVNLDQSKAIKSITKSGGTYTATALDNTSFTFSESITGVKGNAETSYRTGNVNITPANIGAISKTDELLTTNPFAPTVMKGPYISKIDDAFYAADKRWNVTATNISGSASVLFDGSYESLVQIGNNQTAVITIDFSTESDGYFPGYPYGYFLISFYYICAPKSVSGRVYCNYSSQGVGWHDITFTRVGDATVSGAVTYRGYNSYYAISKVEISIVGDGSNSYGYTAVSEIELHLDRPSSNRNPFLSKYSPETLYYDLTAPNFIGNLTGNATSATTATTAGAFTSAKSITLTGDTTGTASSTGGWSLATTTNKLSYQPQLTTQDAIDSFIEASKFMAATFKTTNANSIGMASNDGMIMSLAWQSTAYGAQLALDDITTGVLKIRGRADSVWGDWRTVIHDGNYTNYTVTKTGSGASGTWGISISGNAATASKLATSRSLWGNSFDGSSNISGHIKLPATNSVIQTLADTSNWGLGLGWDKTTSYTQSYRPGIGFFNLGGNNGNGAISIVPYAQDTGPWGGSVGLFLTQDEIKFNNVSLVKNSGTWGISITGNAATSTKWASAQTVYVALGTASKTTSIQGGSSSAVTLGVDGVLGVANGGTGAPSFTANSVIMSGSSTTGAFTTRAVTNNTSASAVTANTNLITANTLAYWTGSSNLTTCSQGTFGTAATYSATTSVTSGSSALVTSGGVSTALGSYVTLSTTQTISGAKTFSAATSFTNTTASTSKSTGAVKVSGGLGVAGQVSANTAMIGDAVSLVYDSSISALCFQFA